jgi:hypothetical protein
MRQHRKARISVTAPLLVAFALAGCAGSPGPTVAAVQQPGPPPAEHVIPAGAAAAEETGLDRALRFARCMAEHGEPVPEPVEGRPLRFGTPVEGTAWMRLDTDAFLACRALLPATWPVKADPADIARERPFGECMRRRGIAWPEPDADGMVAYPADPMSYQTPQYRAAEEACRYLYDDPANNAPR